MPRFAKMLADGMRERGHTVEIWQPTPKVYNLPVPKGLKKWAGYIDQYIVFPSEVKRKLKNYDRSTLFVFSDQALGPWVPLVASRKHVIHCHDFLAQRSAKGEIPQNPTRWSGKKYQSFIHHGYAAGKNFLSVSKKTQLDLHEFLPSKPKFSEVIYNGLNQSFVPGDKESARKEIEQNTGLKLNEGYILHVGGNQWYKNRAGIIEIYNAYRQLNNGNIPLLLMGESPDAFLVEKWNNSPFKENIHFLPGMSDHLVRRAYIGASVFLFPSLAEGFGWPIAEAMASGCMVITTDEAPMTEVAGGCAFLISVMPIESAAIAEWSAKSAKVLKDVLMLKEDERAEQISRGIKNATMFNAGLALDLIEQAYVKILTDE